MSTESAAPATYLETKHRVSDRGNPPDSFLNELVTWANGAEHAVFLPNAEPLDIFALIRPVLGPWFVSEGEPEPYLFHRRAALCEAMRCHAGLESSWNWKEGVDKTNKTSMARIAGQEAGIFQYSFDSTYLEKDGTTLKDCIRKYCGHLNIQNFIDTSKSNHTFAMEYYARLVRINTRWAGPLLRGEILSTLRLQAVDEFIRLLA